MLIKKVSLKSSQSINDITGMEATVTIEVCGSSEKIEKIDKIIDRESLETLHNLDKLLLLNT